MPICFCKGSYRCRDHKRKTLLKQEDITKLSDMKFDRMIDDKWDKERGYRIENNLIMSYRPINRNFNWH